MVAVQVLLMNYFLLGLHSNKQISNNVVPHDTETVCSFGCAHCSQINGCYACKAPYVLVLRSKNTFQLGYCTRSCPKGFYDRYNQNNGMGGICFKCDMEGCRRCSSQNKCTRCSRGYTLDRHQCIRKCPKGFRYDTDCRKCVKIRKEKNGKYSLGCIKYSELSGCLRCKPPFLLILKRDGFLQKGHCSRCCPKTRRKDHLCLRASETKNNTLVSIPLTKDRKRPKLTKAERRKRRRQKKRRRKLRLKKKKHKRRRKKKRRKRIRHCHDLRHDLSTNNSTINR